MIVVNPIEVNESNLVSSSINEPDVFTGEAEWVSTPFDGFDVSSSISNPSSIAKSRINNYYGMADKSTKRIYWFDEYFNLVSTSDPFESYQQLTSIGASPSGSNADYRDATALYYSDPAGWFIQILAYNVTDHGLLGSTSINNAVDDYINQGALGFNPIAHSTLFTGSGAEIMVYVLNKESESVEEYRVIGLTNGPNGVLYFNSIISLNGRTPVSVDCRNGNYSIMFSSPSGTIISYYNSTFTTELSSHTATGVGIDNPCDGFTIDGSGGFRLINEATRKVYNLDSSYNNGSDYKEGDRVIKSAIHKKYQCLIQTSTDPEEGVGLIPPTWLELGATNKWAMFDGINTYPSISSSEVVVTVSPLGIANAVNVFTMANCKEVKIVTTLPDTGDTYMVTHDTSGKFDLVDFDLPPYENPLIEVTFTPEDGLQMSIGELVVGEATRIGVLLAGAVSDRINYSRYTYDEFGNRTYIRRPSVKYITYPIRVLKPDAPGVELFLDEISGKQAVWIGYIGDGDYLIVRGDLERSPMTYDNPSIIEYSLKVRGSI